MDEIKHAAISDESYDPAVVAALDRVRAELARQWPTLAGAWSVATRC